MTPSTTAFADEALTLATETTVSQDGAVHISLTVTNSSGSPVYHVHPMFHFHHAMVMGGMIHKLDPGESVLIENDEHPPVLRAGNYPLVVMAQYKAGMNDSASLVQTHTSSFYYQESLISQVLGAIEYVRESGEGKLRIFLNNQSGSLKNVRLMLLLPPGLVAQEFQEMKGFTLRGGERVSFETPILETQAASLMNGNYPVYLLVEYAEMLKHYSQEIQGEVYFPPIFNFKQHWPHLLAIVLLGSALGLYYNFRRKFRLTEI
ncbi:MAG: hypothetical protein G3M78_09050 [Candidatus Nitrohelix vancouverensis]|uniref:Uncharacterized protein n=1 Tax=Candidatus Nitrohelix vancouverensis TaxID=2705534 RepID=A0A7T0C2U2_9BACT|nr:MAG: hypothetical protein G3M78_09050 [Candidatus Nitrohelix vancouverensis]